ncbi:protoporphyrinogen oxidase HemJ [Aestuariibius insulae]|uniref:protoporphyrinogen oxidase HemJ n=1 Tax=Aestuariibius insulae TaxID=2058287 RepID=UPI00345E8000
MLADLYPWIKALHVISVIAWMAAIFYLPRLYVYHVEEVEPGSKTEEMFQRMERRLLKAIMNPAMIATWIFGLLMVATPGVIDWITAWPWLKAIAVILMSGYHGWLSKKRKELLAGTNTISGRGYRIANEVPTVLMIIIVIAVIVRPIWF